MFSMTFGTDNEAFNEYDYKRETARILREAADKIENNAVASMIYDSNGNRVGRFTLDWDRSDHEEV